MKIHNHLLYLVLGFCLSDAFKMISWTLEMSYYQECSNAGIRPFLIADCANQRHSSGMKFVNIIGINVVSQLFELFGKNE